MALGRSFRTLTAGIRCIIRLVTAAAIALVLAVELVPISALAQESDRSASLTQWDDQWEKLYALFSHAAAVIDREKLLLDLKAKFGNDHTAYAFALATLAVVYQSQGKRAEAEELYQSVLSLAKREKEQADVHSDVTAALGGLAVVLRKQGKYADAEELYRRALAIQDMLLGADHPDVAQTLNSLAYVYRLQGRYAEAAATYQRALAIWEKALGADHPNVALTLNDLAIVYKAQGKYARAESLYQRALAIREKALGAESTAVADTLNNLAVLYESEEKYSQAEKLSQRALAIYEKMLGAGHSNVAIALHNLANVYKDQGRYVQAQALYERALEIYGRMPAADPLIVATTLNNLALVFEEQGKFAEAEGLSQRALSIWEKALGADHPNVATALNGLANVFAHEGKYRQAEEFYQRALTIQVKVLSPDHPYVADTLDNLANLYGTTGNYAQALAMSRKASAAVIAHSAAQAADPAQEPRAEGGIEQRSRYFLRHVANLAIATRQSIEPAAALGSESLEIAQRALQSTAGTAVQQMAARVASGDNALATLVRDQQDAAVFWSERNKALIDALSKPEAQRNQALIENIRNQIAGAEGKLAANAARLQKEFRDYAALATPNPLKPEEVQKLLGPDEALVFFLTSDNESYVFAVTRESFGWKVTPLGGDALVQKVAAFRRGLDVGEPDSFDLGLANELYVILFGPVESVIKDKKHLLVIPSGALTALPLNLLITEKPATPGPNSTSSYRDAAWLIKRQSVAVLPSVSSLRALRELAHKDEARKPMIGFGDPAFNPDTSMAVGRRMSGTAARALTTRSYTDFFRGVGVDRAMLAQVLPPLPETADELKAVAKDLGASLSDIHLGKEANETAVKQLPLADYRVVYFATHALVAGDVKGLGEPALALSIPAQPSDIDDGLLTASEVAQLKLNADWVVLSACNTVAGDRPGAEALSGLARAFFFAGARALLVSHWAVSSDAATRLTTSTFDILKANPTIGRAEALRRSELAYLDDTSAPRNAYPAFWGPFEIVGEGDVR